jgi:hypothetical protein
MKISSNSNDIEKLEHLICFTLSNTFYMEALNQKLLFLYKLYPLIEGIINWISIISLIVKLNKLYC